MCVIPLGVTSDLVFEVKNAVVEVKKEKPYSQPPVEALLQVSKKDSLSFNLSLNMPSEILEVKGQEPVNVRVPVQDPEGKEDSKPYFTIPVQFPGKAQSVFLTKANPKGDWSTAPRQWIFNDAPEVFPAGSIRVVNCSIHVAFVIVGEQKLQLAPGKQTIVRPSAQVIPIRMAVQKDGKTYQTLNTMRKVDASERVVLATFDWDELEPRVLPTPPAKSVLLYMPAQPVAVPTPSAPTASANIPVQMKP